MSAISEEQNARCCAWPRRELLNGHWTKSRSNDQRHAAEAGDHHRGIQSGESHVWSSACVHTRWRQRRIVASDGPHLLLRHSHLRHQVQHVARKKLQGASGGPTVEELTSAFANWLLRPGHSLRLVLEQNPKFQESQGVVGQFVKILSDHGRKQLLIWYESFRTPFVHFFQEKLAWSKRLNNWLK